MNNRYDKQPRYLLVAKESSKGNGITKGSLYEVSDDLSGDPDYVYVHNLDHRSPGHVFRRRFKTTVAIPTRLPTETGTESTGMKHDSDKLLYRPLMSGLAVALTAVSAVLSYGAQKYKVDSWQTVPEGRRRYEDAYYRHQMARQMGEVYDEESGLPHMAHELCNLMFMFWFDFKAGVFTNITKFNPPPKR